MSFYRVMLGGVALIMSACASQGEDRLSSLPSPAQERTVEAFEVENYRLDAGDKIKLVVFGEDALSGEFAVDGTGHVSLPLIGEIKAGGGTVRDFQRAVDDALRDGYLKDPRVSAEVSTYRPFYILGEVGRPGTYPYQNGLTVLNAVATAQGFTYRANERVVFIRRDGETQEEKYSLTSTTPVRPGDTIRIGERFF
ncbi:MAG: polysaccharide biosynthesis/export family protein [Pseudomonadota bacterium]